MPKLPAFQFYPGDWRKDIGVQSLSYHDRGIWFEMLCLMHESLVRGKLLLGGNAVSDEVLAGLLHLPVDELKTAIETLIERGVTERDKRTGALINRRMLRDENSRAENRAKMNGWRKSKETKENRNENETIDVTPMLPLSSSSSSSSITTSKQVLPPSPPEAPDLPVAVPEPEQAAPFPRTFDPDAGSELAYASHLFENLRIPATGHLVRIGGEAIRLLAMDGGTRETAAQFIEHAARDAIADGITINAFWFSERRYQPQGQTKTARQKRIEEWTSSDD